MSEKDSKKHLIKRKDLEYKITNGWLCEVKRDGQPNGSKVKKGDKVYIAQAGYAIFGVGRVAKVKHIQKKSFKEFVKYSLTQSNVKDDNYWLSKIKEYVNKDFKSIHILEYELDNVYQFEFCSPLEKRFLSQSAWYYLEDDFEISHPKRLVELTLHIPSKVRDEVFHLYKINSKIHITDIDHLVPRSLGGPGNIVENLIPISPSINRRKSNSVPSKLFDVGLKHNVNVPRHIKENVKHNKFYSNPSELKLAKQIIEKINSQIDFDKIKDDYLNIKKFHYPNFDYLVDTQ